MTSQEDLAAFIASSFRSVWALEVLCLLRQSPECALSPEELVTAMRASELVVRQSLAELNAAGLILIAEDGFAKYQPATAELDRLVSAAVARYATAPDGVRRIIVKAANSGLTAFADAFRLKRKP
ncbi:hypothetical protein [Altererythrobacter sp. Root672]|uniref:hypothetical protein n=1 Tax=Altererythrobacter sp. Root672 TaxID=1736584 RepID=UPI0006FE9F44|nr:hypothetical protein [Altererythrobacter sp. Root672]KRA79710.1 hypothetical protein ASD76_16940 [Altererythrobacter sp. Root672]